MKIWLVITDNDGGVNPEAFSSEGAAALRFQELVAESWARYLPGEVWPDNADDAYSRLSSLAGFEAWVYRMGPIEVQQ